MGTEREADKEQGRMSEGEGTEEGEKEEESVLGEEGKRKKR